MSTTGGKVRKVAVVKENKTTQFIQLDQERPLSALVKEICNVWNLNGPEDYALHFDDTETLKFISEYNRMDIANGNVLRLAYSVGKTAEEVLQALRNGSDQQKRSALTKLSQVSGDTTFAQEFVNKQGLSVIITLISSETLSCVGSRSLLLKSLFHLMQHDIVSWEILQAPFVKCLCAIINSPKEAAEFQVALELVEAVLMKSSHASVVEEDINYSVLVKSLQQCDLKVKKAIMSLINALLLQVPITKRKSIIDQLQKCLLSKVLLQILVKERWNREISHQFGLYQSLQFSIIACREGINVDPSNKKVQEDIAELVKVAFDVDLDANMTPSSRKHFYAEQCGKLGFSNPSNPAEDFAKCPPGILALDCMIYFARAHGAEYAKVVLENSCHDCSFSKSSVELTSLLCSVLRLGEIPSNQTAEFQPLYLSHDRPFEELYCTTIQLFNKTWKEMRATACDFPKVLNVVREQITRALGKQPISFDDLRNKLAHLSYTEITNLWQNDRKTREEQESQAQPIKQLKERIEPEIMELIKQQRINFMTKGSMFPKSQKGSKVKAKFWFCRLSQSEKMLQYGDVEDANSPNTDNLPHKIAIADIAKLVVGEEGSKKNKKANPHAFAIIFKEEQEVQGCRIERLDFIAPSDICLDLWTDGLNALLGNNMTSKTCQDDCEMLLNMELKIRLLDVEGIAIPEATPKIPDDPWNYNFANDN